MIIKAHFQDKSQYLPTALFCIEMEMSSSIQLEYNDRTDTHVPVILATHVCPNVLWPNGCKYNLQRKHLANPDVVFLIPNRTGWQTCTTQFERITHRRRLGTYGDSTRRKRWCWNWMVFTRLTCLVLKCLYVRLWLVRYSLTIGHRWKEPVLPAIG